MRLPYHGSGSVHPEAGSRIKKYHNFSRDHIPKHHPEVSPPDARITLPSKAICARNTIMPGTSAPRTILQKLIVGRRRRGGTSTISPHPPQGVTQNVGKPEGVHSCQKQIRLYGMNFGRREACCAPNAVGDGGSLVQIASSMRIGDLECKTLWILVFLWVAPCGSCSPNPEPQVGVSNASCG